MNTCVCDLGWGDGGKGKITDILAASHDVVVRYSGGANAGHSIKFNAKTYHLHHLPSGYISGKESVLANGMVIDPVFLADEIQKCDVRGSPLFISDRAHVVMPWHIISDTKKNESIGTTKKGIGPCYADKMNRRNAIRMGDLSREIIDEKFNEFFAIESLFHSDELWEKYKSAAEFLHNFVCDTGQKLRNDIKNHRNILFEGAQGIGLDVDHGFAYPYVTSSGTGPAAIPQSCGLPNLHLDKIIGVMKCYATRVGEGPFDSELGVVKTPYINLRLVECKGIAEYIRERGKEYGVTTGRPRRIGWIDFRLLKYAVESTGTTEIALMHADTVCGLKQIGFIDLNGDLKHVDGWDSTDDSNLMNYIHLIEEKTGVPVKILSYGPDRTETKFL